MTVQVPQYGLLKTMPPGIAEWGWQDEICPSTGTPHKQGYCRTMTQMRRKQLSELLPGVHLEVARDWNKLKNYCKKEETRDPNGEQVHQTNNIPTKYTYAKEVADRIAAMLGPLDRQQVGKWDIKLLMAKVREVALTDISGGREGIEWIIIDPNWKLMWKECGKEVMLRALIKLSRDSINEEQSDEVSPRT